MLMYLATLLFLIIIKKNEKNIEVYLTNIKY